MNVASGTHHCICSVGLWKWLIVGRFVYGRTVDDLFLVVLNP